MIKLYHKDGEWQVWMDTEKGERDGVCLGTGPKVEDALNLAKDEIICAESALNMFQSARALQVELPSVLKLKPIAPPPPPVLVPKGDDVPF